MAGLQSIRDIVRVARARQRRAFRLRRSETTRGTPCVYFLTPDYAAPSGGVRAMYQHVDILNEQGIRAAVLHHRAGFRCRWFANDTVVRYVGATVLGPDDVVVVSELDIDLLAGLDHRQRYVIFNQGVHLTWRCGDTVRQAYESPRLLGLVTVSEHSAEFLRYAFPRCVVHVAHNSLDVDVFKPGAAERERVITFVPRRGYDDARLVLGMLEERGALAGWCVRPLQGLSQAGFAEALRESLIYLALSTQEGFGLPALEAMACGNYVVGYDGFGGREFFRPEFSTRVETGDVLQFAGRLEALLGADPAALAKQGQEASCHAHRRYSVANQRGEVLAAYRAMLQLPAGAGERLLVQA